MMANRSEKSEKSKAIGRAAEDAVAEKLVNSGYSIVCRNYHTRYGEVDIIAKSKVDGGLAFVEVKARSSLRFGTPAAAVTPRKQVKIIKTTQLYLAKNDIFSVPVRFDVAEVFLKNNKVEAINIIEGAFTLTDTEYMWEDYY